MTYFALSLIFLTFGLLRERGVAPFLLAISCIPFANSLSSFFYKFGLYSYDFFFIGLIISFIARSVASGALKLKFQRWAILLFTTILTYSLIAYFSGSKLDVYFLRDLRPAIFALELAAAALILKKPEHLVSERNAICIVTLAGFTNLIWLTLSIAGVISSEDEYYSTNNYKYFDASTYISALFVIYILSRKKTNKPNAESNKLKKEYTIAFFISLASVVLSGYRAVILATVIASTISSIKSPKKLIMALAILPCAAAGFIYLSTYFGATRVIEGLTLEGLAIQLNTRYGPALDVISSFAPVNYLFGAGFGTVFEIDWFGYRSLDTTNNFVDSAYITFFAKYGFIGLMFLCVMILSMRSISPNPLKTPISAYLLVLFFVYAISYQPASAGIIAGCIAISAIHSHRATQKNERTRQLQN